MSVVEHDFGKETREAARALGRLLGLLEEFDVDIAANPRKYLTQAAERLAAAQTLINQLYDAIHLWRLPVIKADTQPELHPLETIRIERKRYEAMVEAEKLIDAAWHKSLT